MVGRGFAAMDKRFDAIEKRLDAIEKRLFLLEQRVAKIEKDVLEDYGNRIGILESKIRMLEMRYSK